MDQIDLRSDTVTWPTERMRRAMAEARVGDDVFGDDPTVLALAARAARRLRRQAAVLVASGTMGNVAAILAHCARGERVILGEKTHTHGSEGGNPATLGGVQPWPVPVQPDGTMRLEDLRAAITPTDDYHYPLTRLICVENTQASVGGQPVPADYVHAVGDLCRANGLRLHVDGARIFNAAAALGTDAADLAADADSVMFCLSKGLCAPIGSVVVGSHELVDRVRRVRKALGGGMRQAGILAAAGILALEEMTERLHEDHATARALAEGLHRIPGFRLDPERVRTNMVFCELLPDAPLDAAALAERLRADGILTRPAPWGFRFVTHYWIKPAHVEQVLARVRYHFGQAGSRAVC
jgi:threonine aldolase